MLKDEIKEAIEEILTGSIEDIASSVSSAKDKVDDIFAGIEEQVYSIADNIKSAENLEEAQESANDLSELYDEL